MSSNGECSNPQLINRLFTYFMTIHVKLRINHLQTTKFARHKATDGLSDALDDLIDRFMEVYIGNTSNRPHNLDCKINVTDVSDDDMESYLRKLRNILIELNNIEEINKSSELLNIRDEMLAEINKTLYLFTLQ